MKKEINEKLINDILKDEEVLFEVSCTGTGCRHPEIQKKNNDALDDECLGCPLWAREWKEYETRRREELSFSASSS